MLQDNCLNLLFAAHDPTAATLAMLLRFLKQKPHVLQELRAEQQQVCLCCACLHGVEHAQHAVTVQASCCIRGFRDGQHCVLHSYETILHGLRKKAIEACLLCVACLCYTQTLLP